MHSLLRILILACAVSTTTLAKAEQDERPGGDSESKHGEFYYGKYLPLLGVTTSLGEQERHGPELGVGYTVCGREGLCAVTGALVGVVSPREFSTGIGLGLGMNPVTSWFEIAARWQSHHASGYHAMFALGSVVMPYVAVDVANPDHRVLMEYGVTTKWLLRVW